MKMNISQEGEFSHPAEMELSPHTLPSAHVSDVVNTRVSLTNIPNISWAIPPPLD